MAAVDVLPGHTDEAHPEYFDIRAMPPQPKEQKPGQLSEALVKQFFEEGYVIVEKFFEKEELDRCCDAISGLVEELAQKLYKAGKIKDLYREYGFYKRLTKLEEEFPGTNILLHKLGTLPQAFRDLWSSERLLNVVEQLIGPDIAGHPVWNIRTKTPQNEATTVPWHQDVGYLDNSSYKVLQPTAWIPLLDSSEINGCMQLAVRGHKTGRVADHTCCYGGTWYVMLDEEEMARKLATSGVVQSIHATVCNHGRNSEDDELGCSSSGKHERWNSINDSREPGLTSRRIKLGFCGFSDLARICSGTSTFATFSFFTTRGEIQTETKGRIGIFLQQQKEAERAFLLQQEEEIRRKQEEEAAVAKKQGCEIESVTLLLDILKELRSLKQIYQTSLLRPKRKRLSRAKQSTPSATTSTVPSFVPIINYNRSSVG